MQITANPIFTSSKILSSRAFALLKGEAAGASDSSEETLYLPTQIVNPDEKKIVIPSTISFRLETGGVSLFQATGGLEEIVRQIAGGKSTIPLELFRQDATIPANWMETEEGKLMLLSRSIIHRGLAHAEEVAGELKEVETLTAMATISAREFVEGAIGKAYVRFLTRGEYVAWFDKRTGKPFYRVGVVVERFADGSIAVIACLRENEELIGADCRVPKTPDEDFLNLAYPLGGFLRKLRGIITGSDKKIKNRSETENFELDFTRKMLESADEVFDPDQWKPETKKGESVYVNIVAADEEAKKLLLAYKYDDGKPGWVIPGGGQEPGETAEEAVRREAKAESGIEIYRGVSGKLYGVHKIIVRQVTPHHKRMTFYCPVNSDVFVPHITERNEISTAKFFTAWEFMAMPYFPWDRAKADPEKKNYKKQLHADDTANVLKLLGKLEHFGLREATLDDYLVFATR